MLFFSGKILYLDNLRLKLINHPTAQQNNDDNFALYSINHIQKLLLYYLKVEFILVLND
jgi:hypothetical protein